jgi:ABC-type phosphate transport system substrate-binding protein
MRNFKIAAGVAAILGASSAFGLAPGTATQLNLTIAGSSAFRDAFNPDFRAYSCQLTSAAPVPSTDFGKTVTVWYRSEDGSIMGVGPLVKNINLGRLDISLANCGGVVRPAGSTYTCPVVGYNATTDIATSGLTYTKVQLGVSDVEPAALTGENWGSQFTFLGSDPGAPFVKSNIGSKSVIGQVFSIVLSNAGPTAGVTNLRRQDITAIFSGAYSDWSQVPNAAGTGTLPAGAITVCRRDTGSGTQTSASIYFNGYGCSTAFYPFVVSPTGPFGNPVTTNLTTGQVKTCITNAAAANIGAIGIAANGNTPTNGTTISIDGSAPSQTNAALGTYQYYVESTFNTPTLYAVPAGEAALATAFTSRLQLNSTAPAGAAIVSLPVGGNVPTVPLTVSTAGVPVALGSKLGNNCFLPQNQN